MPARSNLLRRARVRKRYVLAQGLKVDFARVVPIRPVRERDFALPTAGSDYGPLERVAPRILTEPIACGKDILYICVAQQRTLKGK